MNQCWIESKETTLHWLSSLSFLLRRQKMVEILHIVCQTVQMNLERSRQGSEGMHIWRKLLLIFSCLTRMKMKILQLKLNVGSHYFFMNSATIDLSRTSLCVGAIPNLLGVSTTCLIRGDWRICLRFLEQNPHLREITHNSRQSPLRLQGDSADSS